MEKAKTKIASIVVAATVIGYALYRLRSTSR
ncbi:hypothetical protein SAMN04488556_1422 [Halostagnicola kamekurae]|uniref:Uncharacterized protein n=1 Tax=Halostagnicola kamekurae TaxID=619731 RepID=A0A1I6QPN1_9EURY|nr:hypothetical protein SAMN04488556_1422 [Halostagnicola kamekurae]